MSRVYMYVVDRDFGFAPNPFHGCCTLATCKPRIRKAANIEDWVIGMGGSRLKATGKLIFAMRVTEKITFNDYWNGPAYRNKRPVRNGSLKMMVGDNIYHLDTQTGWFQADSHHSHADGTINQDNLRRDTATDKVLISRHFFYFGKNAPKVPADILKQVHFKNGIGHRVHDSDGSPFLVWLQNKYGRFLNLVEGDPFDFHEGNRRYSVHNNKIS